MNNRFLRNGIVTLVLVVGTAALLFMFIFPTTGREPIPYSGTGSFLELVAKGEVTKVTQSGQTLEIELKKPDPATNKPTIETSLVPSEFTTRVFEDMSASCTSAPTICTTTPTLIGAPPSDSGAWLSILLTAMLPILLIGALLFFMFRQAQGSNNQAMSFGKSRARMFLGNKTVTTFQDVAGVDEAKTE
ncbi:MAG: hypothetical protein ABI797_03030, partial [Chloroflexota bacterium]